MMMAENVAGSAAIRDYVAAENPNASRRCSCRSMGWAQAGLPSIGVVGAHHRTRPGKDRGAKGGQIGVFQIVIGDLHVGAVAGGFRPAVNGEMLRGGQCLQDTSGRPLAVR